MRLLSSIAPVTNSPAGTMTWPPPAFTHAAIADLNASVLSVALFPTAPNFVTSNERDGNDGGLMRARIFGSSRHGSSDVSACSQSSGAQRTATAPAATVFRNSRRLFMSAPDRCRRCPRRQLQQTGGVSVTEVLDHPSDERIVVRQLAAIDVGGDEIAEHAAEVLVARIRHERSRIGHHADESRQQAGVRQRVELPADAVLLVKEPPTAAELNLSGHGAVLEIADHRRERVVVRRIEVVDDDLRQRAFSGEPVEVACERA